MNRQAGGDRRMDRCRDAELQATPNDRAAQCLDLEPTAVFEVSGHRRSPLRGQRRGLLDDAIHSVRQNGTPSPSAIAAISSHAVVSSWRLTTACEEIAAIALGEGVPFWRTLWIASSSRPRRCPRNGDRRWPETSKTA